jgi:hypothetical protein
MTKPIPAAYDRADAAEVSGEAPGAEETKTTAARNTGRVQDSETVA